jgi:hypothetical protein
MRLRSLAGTNERRVWAIAVALSCMVHARDGACQADEDRVGARAAAVEGARAFSEKRWADAIDYFKRAESLVHAPPHLLYMARAQAETGHLVEARENLLSLIHEELKPDAPQVFRSAKESASTDIKGVETRMPYVTVTLKGDAPGDIAFTQDGARVPKALIGIPRPINPGSHKFEAVGKGVAGTAMLDIKESERQKVVLELVPSAGATLPSPAAPATPASPASATPGASVPPESPPPGDVGADKSSGPNGLLIGSFIGFGVGAVGIAVGTIFTLKASSKSKEGDQVYSDNNCAATGCPNQQGTIADLDSQSKSARTLGLVGFIAGGVGVATGVTLLILSSGGKKTASAEGPHVGMLLGPGSLRVAGTF